eukprot:965386-Prymnesium_polylepis.1
MIREVILLHDVFVGEPNLRLTSGHALSRRFRAPGMATFLRAARRARGGCGRLESTGWHRGAQEEEQILVP